LAILGQLDREFLAALYKDPEIAWRCIGALAISASRTGEKFLCPIHREDHPSASVYFDRKRGGLTIWCWHQGRPYTIPQVRAKQVSGEILGRVCKGYVTRTHKMVAAINPMAL
jgi:hypothetical protein